MHATGGAHRTGHVARIGNRRGMIALLAGLALFAGPTAQATGTAPAEPVPPADQGAPPVDNGGAGAPAAPVAPPVDPAAPAEPAIPAPPGLGNGLYMVDGFIAGGHGTGPATFSPLLGDAQFPVPEPPVNEGLPEEVDELGPFVRQVSCDPQDRPGVTAFALLIGEHYGRPGYFGARPCVDYMSFHHDGRALDWSLSAYDPMDRRIADSTLLWLTENDGEMAARFGIENIIWNFQVWDRWSGWQNYAGHPHDDHVHFAFTWDGAQMRTSWWTGVAVADPDLGPCEVPGGFAPTHLFARTQECDPATGGVLPQGLAGGYGVQMVQEMLGLPVTGELDEQTRAGLLAWQMEHDVPATGLTDDITVSALQGLPLPEISAGIAAVLPQRWQLTEFSPYLRTTVTEGDSGPAVAVLQKALGSEPDGDFGPMTAEALRAWEETQPLLAEQAERRGDGPAVVTPLTWTLLERAAHPTIEVRDVALAEGARDQASDPEGVLAATASAEGKSPYAGGAVTMVQTLLQVDADGVFGPMTAAAVAAVQEKAGLEVTGVVDGPTWAAIESWAIEEEVLPGAPGLAAQRERERAEREAQEAAEAKAAAEQLAQEQAAFEQSLVSADR